VTTANEAKKDDIQLAFARHQAGDLDDAERLYNEVLLADPSNLNGLQLLGLLIHQRGRATEAVALLQKAIAVLERNGGETAAHAGLFNNIGNALRAAGRIREASDHYRRGLKLDPNLAELHANLGNALLADGDPANAAASYETALRLGPLSAQCLGNFVHAQYALGKALGDSGDNRGAITALRRCLELDARHAGALHDLGALLAKVGLLDLAVPFLEAAIEAGPDDTKSLAALGNVLQAKGETARALACFRRACALRPLVAWPASNQPADFTALLIQSPGVANTPPDFLLGDARYDRYFFPLLPDAAPDIDVLRRHGDIVVNLISDVDQGHAMLAAAADVVDRIGKRTINHPRRVLGTGRDAVAKLLAGIPLCRVPEAARVTREMLAPQAAAKLDRSGFAFPLLLRVAGTHGGDAFEKIDTGADIAKFLSEHAADEFYVTAYLDYRSGDGHFRKYRFVFVGEAVLPYHLAIGDGWKVHHYTTQMDRHPWMQDEEKAFLENPGGVFSPDHYAAFAAIRAAIGLEFFGIDCSLDRGGNIVVFEVNASMLIHDDNADFPYKTPHCIRIKEAFDAMLKRAATA